MIHELLVVAALMDSPRLEPAHMPVPVLVAQTVSSPDQAAAQARDQTGGRVLGVQWADSGGQPVYLVRVLMPDGSIREVPIPATGQ
ncbi:MAG: PepSY domain-containing protein [Gammaproteobacteria bacterium]